LRIDEGKPVFVGQVIARKADYILALKAIGERRARMSNCSGLKGVVMVESKREIGDKIEREARFSITSLVLPAPALGPMIRDRWAVENSLHWVMDMVFRDDECRIETEHAPANFATPKHLAHSAIRKAPGKDSLRLRRKNVACARARHYKLRGVLPAPLEARTHRTLASQSQGHPNGRDENP